MLQGLEKKKDILISILIIIFLILLDQITKLFFINKNYFNKFFISINYSQNFGSSFSIFENISNYNFYLSLFSIFILIITIYYFKEYFKDKNKKYILILFISGLIGNLIDRIIFGYVNDFIYLKNLFIFNFADIYLSLVFILIIYFEFLKNK